MADKLESVTQRHYDEVLTDNTLIKNCKQCKDCVMWGIGNDPFCNAFDKSNCAMYPNPGHKPMYVINNAGKCEWKVPRK